MQENLENRGRLEAKLCILYVEAFAQLLLTSFFFCKEKKLEGRTGNLLDPDNNIEFLKHLTMLEHRYLCLLMYCFS
jgi:hypothetical protein